MCERYGSIAGSVTTASQPLSSTHFCDKGLNAVVLVVVGTASFEFGSRSGWQPGRGEGEGGEEEQQDDPERGFHVLHRKDRMLLPRERGAGSAGQKGVDRNRIFSLLQPIE